ncbi:MAG TPA: ATP-binding protein, partial [Gaiellaceae bacterium]|nr:ATP-binding protein [Gaiellaceae bacterium]
MSLLLLAFVVMVVVMALMSMSARRMRRNALEEEARRREELRRHAGNGESPQPELPFPFNLFFGEAQSYTYDFETGQWVEITDVSPEPEPEAEAVPERTERERDERPGRPRRPRRTRRRPAQQSSPLGGLLGGGMMGGLGGGSGNFDVQPPEELTTFEDVGGMEALKQEIRDTVGLVLAHPDDAERYGIDWNGILLHGPPGVGKTFFARAIAGEHGLNMIHVSTGDLVGSLVGQSAQNIDKAFQTALDNLPCLLFFDEFDSVAQRRDSTPDQESRRTVNQL